MGLDCFILGIGLLGFCFSTDSTDARLVDGALHLGGGLLSSGWTHSVFGNPGEAWFEKTWLLEKRLLDVVGLHWVWLT